MTCKILPHLLLSSPFRSPQELEEGEITAADEDVKRTDACHRILNLALYETLSGAGSGAAQALQTALQRAEGNLQVSTSWDWQVNLVYVGMHSCLYQILRGACTCASWCAFWASLARDCKAVCRDWAEKHISMRICRHSSQTSNGS